MTRAICYKEWVKTRRVVLLSSALLAAYTAHAFIHTAYLFRVEGAVATWAGMVLKETFLLPGALRWIPLATGLMVALAQFLPEMTEKRLKLTLHLPLPWPRVLAVMLLHGLVTLVILFGLTVGILRAGLAFYYPPEIVGTLAWQALPWFIAGLVGYLFTARACVEPSWRQRVPDVLVAAAALSTCYIDAPAGAYLTAIPFLALLLVVAFLAFFHAASRFKEGVQ